MREYLADAVIPQVPVRQWVLSVRRRVRFFVQRDRGLLGAVARLSVQPIERALRRVLRCGPHGRARAVAFVQRFGSTLDAHVHLHVVALDGLFVPAPEENEEAVAQAQHHEQDDASVNAEAPQRE